jgi:hypothetical protein
VAIINAPSALMKYVAMMQQIKEQEHIFAKRSNLSKLFDLFLKSFIASSVLFLV